MQLRIDDGKIVLLPQDGLPLLLPIIMLPVLKDWL
jgi:hypothetical protein